jgi:hypothetical protein
VTGLGKFLAIVSLFAKGSFFNYWSSPTFFTRQKLCMFWQNGLGYSLGDFFRKRIWSPCPRRSNMFSSVWLFSDLHAKPVT